MLHDQGSRKLSTQQTAPTTDSHRTIRDDTGIRLCTTSYTCTCTCAVGRDVMAKVLLKSVLRERTVYLDK